MMDLFVSVYDIIVSDIRIRLGERTKVPWKGMLIDIKYFGISNKVYHVNGIDIKVWIIDLLRR